MIKFAIAFLVGVLILTVFEELPNWKWIIAIFPILFLGLVIPRSVVVVGIIVGFLWALAHAHIKLHPGFDKNSDTITQ